MTPVVSPGDVGDLYGLIGCVMLDQMDGLSGLACPAKSLVDFTPGGAPKNGPSSVMEVIGVVRSGLDVPIDDPACTHCPSVLLLLVGEYAEAAG